MLVALLGVLKSGAAYVPLDPAYPAERIACILDDSRAAAVVTQENLCESLGPLSVPTICLDRDRQLIDNQQVTTPIAPEAGPRNLAYVIYTSGSTGKPKGVQIEHRAVVNFLASMASRPGLSADDVLLAVTTISFDIAVLELYLPLILGAVVVIAPRETTIDARALDVAIRAYGVTVMQATPATWRLMIQSGWRGNPSLRILCGGEALTAELAQELLPRCAELWNMYGPTETTVWSTCCRVENPRDIHIGTPIGNTQVYVLDANLQPAPVGVPGELMIGGDGLARGYLRRPDLSREKFIANPFVPDAQIYRTGDLARFLRNGTIECLGRVDFQVKIRGFRIELGEIESVLAQQSGIQQAVVVARDDASGEKRLVAYFVPSDSTRPPTVAALREALRAKLPDYMVPAAFCALENVPMTPNGKVDRNRLPEVGIVDVASSTTSQPPSTPLETTLATIWQKLLKISRVGVHDNFFDLGGHSLLAVAVFNEIEKHFRVRLPLAALVRTPTIAGLAKTLEAKQIACANRWPSLVPMSPEGMTPAFYCVHGAGGHVLLYRKLCQYLGKEHSVYGLQSQGIDGNTPPLTSIQAMARHYVAEIRAAQPKGPYHLGGYCLGGTIAYEMARILHEQGEDIALLALLDTYNFAQMRRPGFISAVSQRAYFHLRNLIGVPPRKWPSYLASKFQVMRGGELRLLLRSTLPRLVKWRSTREVSVEQTVLDINHAAALSYRPEPYPGMVTIIKPKTNYSFFPDPEMGWGELAGGLDIITLNVAPHAMLEEPAVQQLAAVLSEKLSSW
jgi:amino acid adenylation domain-containing protein